VTFGVRAHDFGRKEAAELASEIARMGATHVQLAPMKALKGFEADSGASNDLSLFMDKDKVLRIRELFTDQGIRISILGCYFNMAHPEPAIREKGIRQFQNYLSLAREFGTTRVGTETGSVRSDYGPDPRNNSEEAFEDFYRTLEKLIPVAEATGTTVCIEGVAQHIISDARRMDRVLRRIPPPHLAVIFDPVNLLTLENADQQERIFEECFSLWGHRIEVIHLKDFIWEGSTLRVVPLGKGNLNISVLGRLLRNIGSSMDVIIENCPPTLIPNAVEYLKNKGLLVLTHCPIADRDSTFYP